MLRFNQHLKVVTVSLLVSGTVLMAQEKAAAPWHPPLASAPAEPEAEDYGVLTIKLVDFDTAAFHRDLAAIGLRNPEKTPRFTHAHLTVTRPSTEVDENGEPKPQEAIGDYFPLEHVPSWEPLIPIFTEIITEQEAAITKYEKIVFIDKESAEEISQISLAVSQDPENLDAGSQADKDERKEKRAQEILDAKLRYYLPAAKYQLLRLSYDSPSDDERRRAAALLIDAISFTDHQGATELARSSLKRLFSSCAEFMQCFDTISYLSVIASAAPQEILEPDYRNQIEADLQELVSDDPFLGTLLQYRFQTLVTQAKFLAYSGINDLDELGKEPSLSAEQLAEVRGDLDAVIGENSYWRRAIQIVRERYDTAQAKAAAAETAKLNAAAAAKAAADKAAADRAAAEKAAAERAARPVITYDRRGRPIRRPRRS